MKMLTRRGVLVEEMGQTYLAELDADCEEVRTSWPLQAAAITCRVAFCPCAGQKVLTVRGAGRGHGTGPADGPVPREGLAHAKRERGLQGMPREGPARQPLCPDTDGFSLHAAVRVEAHDRKRMEQLCRYITRPARSDERVPLNAAGQVELKLKKPWRDGTTHLVMSPLEFMQRLAALVPRPSLHRIRLHGMLAPNVKLRAQVVSQGSPAPAPTQAPAAAQGPSARGLARLKPPDRAGPHKRLAQAVLGRMPTLPGKPGCRSPTSRERTVIGRPNHETTTV
ncbi:transposase [Ideonella sp.]|uniref:transposase n=1 Tax=Ideonella sp. TaxID=1929293 RepID=UPI003BB6CF67